MVAIAVKLDSRGPVHFRQVRVGRRGRPFTMVKFRTMYMNVGHELHQNYVDWFIKSSGQQPRKGDEVFKLTNDPRVTRVGRFLRKSSLDELPQFWNVLRGDMSLVGPRPERPEFVARFRERYPEYMSRHRVRAGITGWAQVHDLRGNSSIRKRIAYDLYYIDNWTLWMDVKLILHTLRVVLKGTGM